MLDRGARITVRLLFFREGKSKSWIARELGLSRNTVSKYLRDSFERDILGERIKAGIAQAKKKGRPHGRPRSAARHEAKIKRLLADGLTKAAIARKLKIGRTSVIRILSVG